MDLSKTDICVVTEYRNIKDDTTLAYVGAIKGRLPNDNERVILMMIIQSIKKNIGKKVDIHQLFETCHETKLNINKGSSSNHFQSVGGSYGIGVCRKYFVQDNLASFGQFSFQKDKGEENIFLKNGIKNGMLWVASQLKTCWI